MSNYFFFSSGRMSALFISLFVLALVVLFYYAIALYIQFVLELNSINKNINKILLLLLLQLSFCFSPDNKYSTLYCTHWRFPKEPFGIASARLFYRHKPYLSHQWWNKHSEMYQIWHRTSHGNWEGEALLKFAHTLGAIPGESKFCFPCVFPY